MKSRTSSLTGTWVLVTGASSGLGRRMAERLAERHAANLILVARRRDLLEDVAAKVCSYGVEARLVELDLTTDDAVPTLTATLANIEDVSAAILCAGLTYFGDATEMSDSDVRRLNAINVDSTAMLLLMLTKIFNKRNVSGRILVISSMASLIPIPFLAAYSSSKIYIVSFISAFRKEQCNSKISITIAYPLGMDTEMTRDSRLQRMIKKNSMGSISVTQCADQAIDDFLRRKSVSLAGLPSRALYFLAMILPRTWMTAMSGRIYRKAWIDK